MSETVVRPAPEPALVSGSISRPASRGWRPDEASAIGITVVMPTVGFDADCAAAARRVQECIDARGLAAQFIIALHGPAAEPDLGMRVVAAGGRIEIDPRLRCKHLKRWTLASMIHTDVFRRAVPWTRMLVARRSMPTALAIDRKNRACGVFSLVLVAALAATPFLPHAAAVAAACGGAILACHHDFYRLCLRKRGLSFALGAFALHVLFFVYSSITFGVVVLGQALARPGRRPQAAGDSA